MNYLVWRHESSIGNSAEQVIGLAKYLHNYPDDDVVILCETDFQVAFCMCIPGIGIKNIAQLDSSNCDLTKIKSILQEYPRLIIPNVYKDSTIQQPAYWGGWKDLENEPHNILKFPKNYIHDQILNLPKDAIIIQIREKGTYWKRVDGAESEPLRFVNPQTYFDVALFYANHGHTVVRLGDANQTPMPEHKNILDFAKFEGRKMMDDLWLIANSKVFLSSDSGIWPMAGGFGTNLVLSNVVGHHYTDWLPKETSTVIFKEGEKDNSFEQLINAVNKYL